AVPAGGIVAAGGGVSTGGLVTGGAESNVSGQLESGSEVAPGDESVRPLLIVEEGGHAGIVCSVGGSGGHTSVSTGIAPWSGAASSMGAPVGRSAGFAGGLLRPA